MKFDLAKTAWAILAVIVALSGCSAPAPAVSPPPSEIAIHTNTPISSSPAQSPTPPAFTASPVANPGASAASQPPPCVEADLLFDPQEQRLLLVNCFSQPASTDPPNAIWSWDGNTWEIVDGGGPPGRVVTGAAYDERRDVLVVYGGQPLTSEQCSRETWEWDRQFWKMVDANSPTACDHFKMIYDAGMEKVILFGGQDEQMRPVAETWSYNGEEWQKVSDSGPDSRAHFGFVYDREHQQALLYGGFDGSARDDFWSLREGIWQSISFPGPGRRSHFGMAFDEEQVALVIFGGATSGSTFSSLNAETWVLKDGAWSQVSTEGPTPRGSPAMAFDPARNRILLYGGFDAGGNELADTWEWDGQGWTCMSHCP